MRKRKRKKNEALTHVSVNANSRKNILTKISQFSSALLCWDCCADCKQNERRTWKERTTTFRYIGARESCFEMWNQHYQSWNNENIMCWFFRLSRADSSTLRLELDISNWNWETMNIFLLARRLTGIFFGWDWIIICAINSLLWNETYTRINSRIHSILIQSFQYLFLQV